MPTTKTPLRYPGGKSRIAGYVERLARSDYGLRSAYAEPYAGGSGVAVHMLLLDAAERIYINDINPGIAAFWHSVANQAAALCELIENAELSIAEWKRQREIFCSDDSSTLARGFATFYLNRTNRSGILLGGVIGGRNQSGLWKLNARFNKRTAISKIRQIAAKSDRLHVSDLDAVSFLGHVDKLHGVDAFYFIDPPYFNKCDDRLYINKYLKSDHAKVASAITSLSGQWLLTYDDSPEILNLYSGFKSTTFSLSYSAGNSKKGRELIFYSHGLKALALPEPLTAHHA